MSWCRKCGTELGWFNTGAAGDLCKACQGEKDEERSHRFRVEMAAIESMSRERAWEEKVERDQKAFKDQEREEQRREYVTRIIAAADSLLDEMDAVPDDAGARLDFIARLAAFFPKSWEEWLVADGVVPHRVEVAYARHRAVVVPLLEAAVAARTEFPTSPDRLLRTLATSFLLKDFDAIRSVQRDLPTRLEPIRQRARDVAERIKALTAEKQAKNREISEKRNSFILGTFSALKGRTEVVIEAEIQELDEDILKEKQVIAGLKEEAQRAKLTFELSRGDSALRSILGTLDGKTETPDDEFLLLEGTPPAASPPAVQSAPRQIDLTPEQSELIRLLRDMLAMTPSDIFSSWQYPNVVRSAKGRYRTAKDEAAAVGTSMALVRKLLNPAQELSNLLRDCQSTDDVLPERHVRAVTAVVREAEAGLNDRPAPPTAKVVTGVALGGLLLLVLGLVLTSGPAAFVGLVTTLGGAAGAVRCWMPWFVRRKLCRDIRHYLSPFLTQPSRDDPGG